MKWLIALFAFFYLVFQSPMVFAIENLPSYLTMDPDFQRRALGPLCYSMDRLEEHLPCNPAFLARERDVKFDATLALGENVSALRNLHAIFDSRVEESMIRDIFAGHNELVLEGDIKGSVKYKLWGVSLTPYRAYAYSVIRNHAYPIIDVQAVQEKSASLQLASYMDSDFHLGAQLRFADRQIISGQAALFDLLAEDGQGLLRDYQQSAFYFEPGVLWKREDSNFSASAMVTDLGYLSRRIEGYTSDPKLQLGGVWSPEMHNHNSYLQLGLGMTFGEKPDRLENFLRPGVSYGLGISEFAFSFSRISQSGGILLRLSHFKLGLTYNRNEIWVDDYLEAVFENYMGTVGFEL